jgi:glycerophosphoryl diester phosphodiesterase
VAPDAQSLPRTSLAGILPPPHLNVFSTDLNCIGHRGAAGYEPENTLRSIRRALDLGVDGVEVDVQLVDGELVIFHDSKLERTTNGRGYLSRQTFAALRALDAGLGEQIPTLREVCDIMRGPAFLNIELKGRGTAAPVAALIERLVKEEGRSYADFLVSSFSVRELKVFRLEGTCEIPVGLLLARPTHFWRRIARLLNAATVNPSARFVSEKMVEQAHAQGWKVFPYTVNVPEQIRRMREMGVDGVFTDFPDRVLSLRERQTGSPD